VCLRGASEVESELFAKEPSPELSAFVVWVPVDGGAEKDVDFATTKVPDGRVLHEWDAKGALAKAYRKTLALSEDAWDVYLIYRPGVRWEAGEIPPQPDLWMHQLGNPKSPRANAPWLDARLFAERARAMLASRAVSGPRANERSARDRTSEGNPISPPGGSTR
jgi:hypothetical protein